MTKRTARTTVFVIAPLLAATMGAACAPEPGGLPRARDGAADDSREPSPSKPGASKGAGASSGSAGDDGGGAPDRGDETLAEPATPEIPGLGPYVEGQMARLRLPGVAVAIVKGEKLVWSRGFGFAHVAAKVPVTTSTLFHLASVSKTVTAVAAMRVVEAGLALDGDVSGTVGFSVRNPNFARAPISLRMLLAHASSITDSDLLFNLTVKNKPSPVSLAQLATGYFTPGGAYYDATKNFDSDAPGSAAIYSNAGVALAGYVVEARARVPFDEYCKAQIFSPLGMTESSFRLASLDAAHLAMQYDSDGVTELGHDDYPDFPNGELRTSVNQFARFLLMFMNDGAYGGVRVLEALTVQQMQRAQFPALDADQGIGWYYQERGARRVLGHAGAVPGVSTIMGFNPSTHVGAIVFSNGNAHSGDAPISDAFDAIFDHLLDVGERL